MTAKSTTALKASVTTDIPNNTTAQVSPADVRENIIDILDSMPQTDGSGDATCTSLKITGNNSLSLDGSATVFDDLLVPATQTKQGVNSKPDFDYNNLGYSFPQNNTSEELLMNIQLPHQWKVGSTVYPHVHWIQTAAENVTWKISYRWYDNGEGLGGWQVYTMDQPVFPYLGVATGQISNGTTGIAGTGMNISSILQVKLYRDDNTYIGDALMTSFDVHYEIDSLGSREEYSK